MTEIIEPIKRKRAVSVQQLLATKFKSMEFDGEWRESVGQSPQMSGIWMMWGHSGNGKTRAAIKLAKFLTRFGKVLYNSLEEGVRKSLRKAVLEMGMAQVSRRFIMVHREPLDEL